jgi:hypothetical protein
MEQAVKEDREYQIKRIEKRLQELESEKKDLLKDYDKLTSLDMATPSTEYGGSTRNYDLNLPAEKVSLFLKMFGCRRDVFPRYWENARNGKKGYSPVCQNEWKPGICEKPRVKWSACPNKKFETLNEDNVRKHLQGKMIAGTYAI